MEEERELTLEELDNVATYKGELPREFVIEKSLEHEDIFRKQSIERLKQERENLLNQQHINGRSR